MAIVVIGQVVVAMGLGIWSQSEITRNSYREYQRRAASEEKQAAKQIGDRCAVLIKSRQAVATCLSDGVQAHHNQSNSDQDLQAQIQTAFWTKWSAVAALFGLPIAVGGLLALWLSLRQTRQAITNDREIGNAQVRAYVAVTPLQLGGFFVGGVPQATFGLENKGGTPAYSVNHIAMVEVLPFPLPDNQGDMVEPIPDTHVPDQALHNGGKVIGESTGFGPLSRQDFDRALEGNGYRLYLVGKAGYTDVFKIAHATKFCAYVEPDVLRRATAEAMGNRPVMVEWIFSHVHNEAT